MIFPHAEHMMDFINPTEAIVGTRQSVQGFSVFEDYAVILYHSGICAVYDLLTRDPAPISAFKLATYDAGEEDKRYANHANDMMFGGTDAAGNPLMYITAGNSGEWDAQGRWIGYCAVEALDITRGEDGRATAFSSHLVQKIYYKNEGTENTPYEIPGWGWPASLVDVANGRYYMHSARHRTTKDFVDKYNENDYIVTAFALPDPSIPEVTLTGADILDQFTYPYDILATQGGTIFEDKLYYTFGFGKVGYPIGMRIADLTQKKLISRIDFSFTPFGRVEIECCAPYAGKMLLNTQHNKETSVGQIYAFDFEELLRDVV